MTNPDQGNTRAEHDSAEDVFLSFMARRDAGEEVSFDVFCRDHPQLEHRLRELYDTWAEVGGMLEAAWGERSDATSSPASEIFGRLGQRTNRWDRYAEPSEIARGGMGVVYKVWDGDLRRSLAMKFAADGRSGQVGSYGELEPSTLGRFLLEAQIAAQLDHPGIVPVHEVGLDDRNRAYFTMRLVRGEDLKAVFEAVRTGRDGWNVTRVLGVLLKAAEAVAFAHDRGVIHRDLKPANIMVGPLTETYVMDWGLAKVLGREGQDANPQKELGEHETPNPDDLMETEPGTVFGTLLYMPPEQARGAIDELGPASDVYAFGAMLYELLSGAPPFADEARRRMVRRELAEIIASRSPVPLASTNPTVSPELVAICEKAMARDPGDRYADMGEMASDLRSYLENRVVRAYETGAFAELRKWTVRNRAVAALSIVALFAVFFGLAGIGYTKASAATTLAHKNEELSEAKLATEQALHFMTGMFESQTPRRAVGETITVKSVLDRAAKQVPAELADYPHGRALLMKSMGQVYKSLGLYDEAEPLLRRAAELLTEELGRDHAETVKTQLLLGETHRMLGSADVADEIYRALESSAQVEQDPLTLSELHHHLGALRCSQGQYDEAERLLQRALAEREAALDGRDDRTRRILQDLADVYLRQDRYADAERTLLTISSQTEESLGANDPATLNLRSKLGRAYANSGRWREAETEFQTLLPIYERVLGPDHLDTLTAANDLALVYGRTDRDAEAAVLLEETLSAVTKAHGEEHNVALSTLNNLALAHRSLARAATDQNDWREHGAKAEEQLDKLCTLRERVSGPDHSATITARLNLAAFYCERSRFPDAEPIYREVISQIDSSVEDHTASLVQACHDLGRILQLSSREEEAEDLFIRALDLEDDLGPLHPLTLTVFTSYGLLCVRLDRLEEAEEYFAESVDRHREAYGPKNSDTLVALGYLAQAYGELEEWEKAEEAARELLEATPEGSRLYPQRKRLLESILQLAGDR